MPIPPIALILCLNWKQIMSFQIDGDLLSSLVTTETDEQDTLARI